MEFPGGLRKKKKGPRNRMRPGEGLMIFLSCEVGCDGVYHCCL